MSAAYDDAQHYLDLRLAGWTDPSVDPHEMIASLVAAEFDSQETMVTQETYDEDIAAKDKEIEDLTTAHEEALKVAARDGLKTASIEDLMDALRIAIEHKTTRVTGTVYAQGRERGIEEGRALGRRDAETARKAEKIAKKNAARTRKHQRAQADRVAAANTNETPAVDTASKGT